MLFYLLYTSTTYVYPGFGFTGGEKGSKINRSLDNPLLPNGNIKNATALPSNITSYEELDPNYIAKTSDQDNMISRANFLTTPTPDAVKEKILEKSDHNDSLPFDYTQGFIALPNDIGMTQSNDNAILNADKQLTEPGFSKADNPQALILDPDDPKNNVIVDLPPGQNYYPANNPYVIVSTGGPFKLKEGNGKNKRDRN